MGRRKKELPWQLGRKAMIGSLVICHLWGTALVYSAVAGKGSDAIGEMFNGVGFMIFSILGILVGGKGWKDFAALRWNAENKKEDDGYEFEQFDTAPAEGGDYDQRRRGPSDQSCGGGI